MEKRKVLFVDDQEDNLKFLETILYKEKYDRIYCQSGKEAMKLLEKEDIDVLVTDLIMPKMGGIELLDNIKKEYPNMARLVMGSCDSIPVLSSAINDGRIYRYIVKPFNDEIMMKKNIRAALKYVEYLKYKRDMKLIKESSVLIKLDKLREILEIDDKTYVLLNEKEEVVSFSRIFENILNVGTKLTNQNGNMAAFKHFKEYEIEWGYKLLIYK